MSNELKEILDAQNGLLFYEAALSPVFCKPKLIPLKSVTLEKLEEMQRESMEAMRRMEGETREITKMEKEGQRMNVSKDGAADIWTPEEGERAVEI